MWNITKYLTLNSGAMGRKKTFQFENTLYSLLQFNRSIFTVQYSSIDLK